MSIIKVRNLNGKLIAVILNDGTIEIVNGKIRTVIKPIAKVEYKIFSEQIK
jgi:hypothetical protein